MRQEHTQSVAYHVFLQNWTWLSKHVLPFMSDTKACHEKSCHAASVPPAWKASSLRGAVSCSEQDEPQSKMEPLWRTDKQSCACNRKLP